MNKDKDFISLFFIPLGTGTNVSISPKWEIYFLFSIFYHSHYLTVYFA